MTGRASGIKNVKDELCFRLSIVTFILLADESQNAGCTSEYFIASC